MSDWYYCLDHQTVEPYDGCRSADRLGPYATQDEAANALHKVQVRNEQWEAAEDAELSEDERRDKEDRERFGGPFGF